MKEIAPVHARPMRMSCGLRVRPVDVGCSVLLVWLNPSARASSSSRAFQVQRSRVGMCLSRSSPFGARAWGAAVLYKPNECRNGVLREFLKHLDWNRWMLWEVAKPFA